MTLKKAGITNYEPFLIESAKDFSRFNSDNYEKLLAIQSEWKNRVIEERKEIIQSIENVINTELTICQKGE
jgi:hypothetical protein